MAKIMIDENLWDRMATAITVADPSAFSAVMTEDEYNVLLRDIGKKADAIQRRIEFSQNLKKRPQ